MEPIDSELGPKLLESETPQFLRPIVAAAFRELVEETGIWLVDGPIQTKSDARPSGASVYEAASAAGVTFLSEDLVHFANWITPTALPRRYDTHFFAAVASPGAAAEPDFSELDATEWVAPSRALELAGSGQWSISAPTMRTLLDLSMSRTAAAFVARARASGPVVAQRPRLRITAANIDAVAPGEPGFEDLPDLPSDPELAARLGEITPGVLGRRES